MAKKPASKKTTAVAKKADAGLPAEVMDQMAQDSGGGFENTTSDDYAIPFLSLLQKMSPAVDEDDPKYVKGAKPGMFMNSVTNELFEDAIRVQPCARVREFVEWIDRDSGGGIAGRYNQDDPVLGRMRRDGVKMFNPDNGNEIMDTRYHYVLLLKDDGTHEQAVISMSSSQIKSSKNWMTRMRSWMIDGPAGMFNPPMYGQVWTMAPRREQNDDGSWYGFTISGDPELVSDPEMYAQGKGFGEMANANKVRLAQEPGGDGGDGPEDEIPF